MLISKRIISVGGLFLCFILQLQAQSAAMQAQRQTAQFQQFAMQNARTFHQQSMMFQNMHLMMNNSMPSTSKKYKFHVVTLAGDTINPKKSVKIDFYTPITELKLKTQSGEQTFEPRETKAIFVTKGKTVVNGIPYIPLDTIVAKRKIKGNIDKPIKKEEVEIKLSDVTSSSKSTLDLLEDQKKKADQKAVASTTYWIFKVYSVGDLTFYSPFPESITAFLTLYQQGNEPIKPLTPEAVAQLVKGNEKAEKAVAKKKLSKALDIFIKAETKKEKARLKHWENACRIQIP